MIEEAIDYRLEEQAGFLLRRATQRHLAIFARTVGDLTPPQFAALCMLHREGPMAQSALGVAVAMDAATIKGVIDRLAARGLVALASDPDDRRKVMAQLTHDGMREVERLLPLAERITAETLAPLSAREAATLQRLLAKLG
ncbi:MAG: MarR family transcriptional regulator [Mesorhizobium amorphae]|nr:MAG: MarR family transcriptional regulator [Mesorhizobium amorphae]